MAKKRRLVSMLVMIICLSSILVAYAASSGATQRVTLGDSSTVNAYFSASATDANLIGFATCKGIFYFSDEYDSSGNLKSTFDSCANRDAIAVTFPQCTLYNLRTGGTVATYEFSTSERFCNISGTAYVPMVQNWK